MKEVELLEVKANKMMVGQGQSYIPMQSYRYVPIQPIHEAITPLEGYVKHDIEEFNIPIHHFVEYDALSRTDHFFALTPRAKLLFGMLYEVKLTEVEGRIAVLRDLNMGLQQDIGEALIKIKQLEEKKPSFWQRTKQKLRNII